MKLKMSLRHILSKYKWVAVALLVLMFLAFTIAILQYNKSQNKKEYSELISEYNELVHDYNAKVDMLNTFLDKTSSYDLLEYSEDFVHKDELDESEMKVSNDDLSTLKERIENIKTDNSTIKQQYQEACQVSYDSIVDEYNNVVKRYNDFVKTTSVDLIQDMPKKLNTIDTHSINVENDFTEEDFIKELDEIQNKLNETVEYYRIVDQITSPTEEWTIERLSQIKNVAETKAVTSNNDPNGLLNKDGGYSSCIYFNVNSDNIKKVTGDDIINEGVDCGGAVEIYPTLQSALNRCDYLSQFDGTLLYSGSYAIIGTCVIRTSYKLNDQEQVDLTNDIVKALTAIKTDKEANS